jgi:hypothetical protein
MPSTVSTLRISPALVHQIAQELLLGAKLRRFTLGKREGVDVEQNVAQVVDVVVVLLTRLLGRVLLSIVHALRAPTVLRQVREQLLARCEDEQSRAR